MLGSTKAALLVLLGTASLVFGQLSKPIVTDSNVDDAANKFLGRQATADQATLSTPGCVWPRSDAMLEPVTVLESLEVE